MKIVFRLPAVIFSLVAASAKVFELRHQCQTTSAATGFGRGSPWTTSVYSVVKIRKTN